MAAELNPTGTAPQPLNEGENEQFNSGTADGEDKVNGSHVGEGEDMTQNKEDDDSNMMVADSEFEELLKQFSLRLQAVHNIPQNSSMLSSAKSSRFLKLRPNVSNVWLH